MLYDKTVYMLGAHLLNMEMTMTVHDDESIWEERIAFLGEPNHISI